MILQVTGGKLQYICVTSGVRCEWYTTDVNNRWSIIKHNNDLLLRFLQKAALTTIRIINCITHTYVAQLSSPSCSKVINPSPNGQYRKIIFSAPITQFRCSKPLRCVQFLLFINWNENKCFNILKIGVLYIYIYYRNMNSFSSYKSFYFIFIG